MIKRLYSRPNLVPVTLTLPGSCRGKLKSLSNIHQDPCRRRLMKIHDAAGCCGLRTVAAGRGPDGLLCMDDLLCPRGLAF
jgi:hypothetical protein